MSDRDLFLAYGALMAGALVPIYHGAYASLKPAKLAPAAAGADVEDDTDDDEEHDGVRAETLTSAEAWMFPVLGSCVLFGMYLVFKYIDRRYVDVLLAAYFGAVGGAAVCKTLVSLTRGVMGRNAWRSLSQYKLRLTRAGGAKKKGVKAVKTGEELFTATLTTLHPILLVVSGLLVLAYFYTRSWALSNLIALALSYNAISIMAIDSFRTGSIMLGGLFVYDIFWVFGTDVMVSVARGFDGPIKITWPKNFVQGMWELVDGKSPTWKLTMLGLGDIVIPGIFIALALRFDLAQHRLAHPTSRTRRSFPRPYFRACLVAYVAGLGVTMGVMHVFKAAQPALLYLSPACVGAIALTAVRRGEWAAVWGWSDDEEEEDKDAEEKKDKDE